MIFPKGRLSFVITVIMLITVVLPAAAAYDRVVTFGADLDMAQKAMLASDFGINLAAGDVPEVNVTNAEERKYLEGLAPEEAIGNRAISSALVEVLPAGQGIRVQSSNITWVSDDMYVNALATAQVKDARIHVAAPFPVSGTAALTGIFKAFEVATGNNLGDRSKKVANEELVKTVNLGREIGREKASKLVLLVKERVIAEGTRDPVRIRQIIINIAGDLNIQLTEQQVRDIVALMQKISTLDLKVRDISDQLSRLKTGVERSVTQETEVKNWLRRLLDTINRLVEQIRTLLLGE